ncbi:MAG: hypothetical protein ACI4P3_05945 [Candidatus Spyradosoma sp.]
MQNVAQIREFMPNQRSAKKVGISFYTLRENKEEWVRRAREEGLTLSDWIQRAIEKYLKTQKR